MLRLKLFQIKTQTMGLQRFVMEKTPPPLSFFCDPGTRYSGMIIIEYFEYNPDNEYKRNNDTLDIIIFYFFCWHFTTVKLSWPSCKLQDCLKLKDFLPVSSRWMKACRQLERIFNFYERTEVVTTSSCSCIDICYEKPEHWNHQQK